jgi:hypothetical protein
MVALQENSPYSSPFTERKQEIDNLTRSRPAIDIVTDKKQDIFFRERAILDDMIEESTQLITAPMDITDSKDSPLMVGEI